MNDIFIAIFKTAYEEVEKSKIYMTTKFIHSKDNVVFLALSMANQIGEWRNR